MAATWSEAIKDQIWQQLRQQKISNRFIGKYKLQEIWRITFQNHFEVVPDPEIRHIRDCLLDSQDDQRLLILASVLVYIDWSDWNNFRKSFTDEQGKAHFELPLSEETATALVGSKGPNFLDSQLVFLPVTIVQGDNLQFSESDKLPFTEEECNTSVGVSATVKKIVIDKGYFRDARGDTNQQQRVLARKRFHYPEDYATEIEFLDKIRSNIRSHSHVLAHMSTIAIGTRDFSVLSEFADRGDLQQFLLGSFSGYETHRNRIIEETAQVADAIDFLHKNLHVAGDHRPFYHLDLKPANVLIFSHPVNEPQKRDDIGTWVITDFGVSAFHERNVEDASKTTPRREPGTYQPPEIDDRLGLPRVNAKGDIWSLGGILCMVLAFLLAGSQGVKDHIQQRNQTTVDSRMQDFYYEITRETLPRAVLKPGIRDWLKGFEDSTPDVAWRSGMIDLIRQCLSVDEHDRPDAISVCKLLFRSQVRDEEELEQPPTLSKSTTEPIPELSKIVGREIEPLMRPLSLNPSLTDSTSTDSSTISRISSSPVGTLGPIGGAKRAAIDSCGQHIVLCYLKGTLIFDLLPTLRQRPVVPGDFEYINLAGHYLILYEKSSSQPTFESLATDPDRSFTRLSEEAAKFRTALKTAVSARGEVVLMQPRTLRAPKYLSPPYEIPKNYGDDKFRTVSFDRRGSRLWACGSKHWFMWKVDSDDPNWLLQPKVGSFAVEQDWRPAKYSIFALNNRSAMCLYNHETQTLRLFDVSQNNDSQVMLETPLLCAIVGCNDDQIFYVRRSKTPHRLGLYSRPIQGITFGNEVLHSADLSSFSPKADFAIACQEESSAQVFVVLSTSGQYQFHRVDFEERVV